MHAKSLGHSLLLMHSGLHAGGLPTNSGKQVQTGAPLASLQSAFGPQGDGWQGFTGGGGGNGSFSREQISFRKNQSITLSCNTYRETSSEWVACVLFGATAYWVMIDDFTSGSDSTSTNAGIYTFLVCAGPD